jgi:hypothetical protein
MRIGRENTYASAILFTTNCTLHCLGLNPGHRGLKSETNCLSCGTAYPTNSSKECQLKHNDCRSYFSCGSTAQFRALAAS